MSRTDENGTAHPTLDDPVTTWGNAHIATCPDCMKQFGGPEGKPLADDFLSEQKADAWDEGYQDAAEYERGYLGAVPDNPYRKDKTR